MPEEKGLAKLRSAVDSDRRRLCDALEMQPHNGRFFCPLCQADGQPHADGDFSIEAGFRCHKCGWSGDGFAVVQTVRDCDFPDAVAFVRNVYAVPATVESVPRPERKPKKVHATLDDIFVTAEPAAEQKSDSGAK